MLCDTIKTILGNELVAQVEAALKGKGKDGKDVDVVVGNDGTFVPAEKYTGVQSQASKAESMVKAVADSLKGIGGSGDPAKLSEDVKAALGKIDMLNKEHQKEIEQIKKTRPSGWRWPAGYTILRMCFRCLHLTRSSLTRAAG